MELDDQQAVNHQYLDLHDPEDTLLAAEDAKFSIAKSMLASLSVLERSTIALEAGLQSSSVEAHRLLLLQKHEQQEKEAAVVHNAKIYAEKNAHMHIRKMLRKVVKEDHLFFQHPHAPVTPVQQDVQDEGSSITSSPSADAPEKPTPVAPKHHVPHVPKKHHAVGFGSGLKRMLSSPGCDKVHAKPGNNKDGVLGNRSKTGMSRLEAAAAAAALSVTRPRSDSSCDVIITPQPDTVLLDDTEECTPQSVCSTDINIGNHLSVREAPVVRDSQLAICAIQTNAQTPTDTSNGQQRRSLDSVQDGQRRKTFRLPSAGEPPTVADQAVCIEQPLLRSPNPQALLSRSSSPAPGRCLPSLNHPSSPIDSGRVAFLKDAISPLKPSRSAVNAEKQRSNAGCSEPSYAQPQPASPQPSCGSIKSRWSSSSPLPPPITSDSAALPRSDIAVIAYPELGRIGGSGGLLKFVNQVSGDQLKSKVATLANDMASAAVRTHSADSAFIGQHALQTSYMFEPMRKRRLKGLQNAGHASKQT